MILVTGAGGKTGRALIKALPKSASVCAFVHREEQASMLKGMGVEKIIVGELRDETVLRKALQGVRSVYHICPNMNPDEMEIGRSVIDAARAAGVEQFAYHSVLHPHTADMPHHWGKLHVEEMLFESGLAFTILQPAPYMQNLLVGWKTIVGEGVLRVPYSVNAQFSFVDLEDVAQAAAAVLTQPNHMNATYELAGPSALSHAEAARILARLWDRPVRPEQEELEDWEQRSRAAGMAEYRMENLAKMFKYYDRWGLTGNPNVLHWLLGREPTTLEMFLERMVQEQESKLRAGPGI
jgi:NAD(P)H dehydrogenase (quinone)